MRVAYDERLDALNEILTAAKEAVWLYEKFGDGEYRDVLGLCKAASLADIEEKGFSLTPGAYVGVAPWGGFYTENGRDSPGIVSIAKEIQ